MKNSSLLNSLSNCINHCNFCASKCLEEDDVKKMISCIQLDRACASVCTTTATLMAAETSINLVPILSYCQQLCEECAEECKKHSTTHCQQCATACKECAAKCKEYLS
ncbi:four-helix bundle copper-binding protein [Mesonia aquimarina]|uniref:four-helix bundle copper-binding protein n=1 Tax=Mesonia aquimarina TaxID=1504967 RepID=UPI000EF58FF6|nr:four-helix bundle copper-binding protein [Mesonia aquimarina]